MYRSVENGCAASVVMSILSKVESEPWTKYELICSAAVEIRLCKHPLSSRAHLFRGRTHVCSVPHRPYLKMQFVPLRYRIARTHIQSPETTPSPLRGQQAIYGLPPLKSSPKVPGRVERFGCRATESFELFKSEFGQNSVRIQENSQNPSEILTI